MIYANFHFLFFFSLFLLYENSLLFAYDPAINKICHQLTTATTFNLTFVRVCSPCTTNSALCNEDANGNVPLGKSCNRYWQCQGGYPRLQRCPAMLVFDRHSLRCVVPPTEECDIPTTPTPLDGDGDNNNVNGGQLAKDEQERKVSERK